MMTPERKAAERLFEHFPITFKGDESYAARIIAEELAPMREMMERMALLLKKIGGVCCPCPLCTSVRDALTDYAEMKAAEEEGNGEIRAEEVVDSIIDAAREGMVDEDRVRELIGEGQGRKPEVIYADGGLTEQRVRELITEHDENLLAHLPAFTEREKLYGDRVKELITERIQAAIQTELVDAPEPASEPAPAPWIPKVGEWAYCHQQIFGNLPSYTGICKVQSIHGDYCIVRTLDTVQIPSILLTNLRPVVASDWIVDVPGFGKVAAWYNKHGNLVVAIDGVDDCVYKARGSVLRLALAWLNTHNVPVKPYSERIKDKEER